MTCESKTCIPSLTELQEGIEIWACVNLMQSAGCRPKLCPAACARAHMLECLKRAWRLCGQTDSCCGYLCPCLRIPSSGAVTSQAGNAWKVHSPGPCSPTPAPPAHTSAGTVQGQLVKSLLGQEMGQQGIQQGVQASILQRQPIRAVINSVVHCDSSTAAATPPDCIACTAHQYQKQRPEAAKSACFLQH